LPLIHRAHGVEALEKTSGNDGPTLGSALRSIRAERGWSLRDVSERTGLSVSMLSKVENGQRSLTYDKLLQLSQRLSIDISRLFSERGAEPQPNPHSGRRAVQRQGAGFVVESGVYTYRYLAQELVRKKFLPVLMDLNSRSIKDFGALLRHGGEEFAMVLEGEVDVHTEVYAPLRLEVGDSIYFDSSLGHAYINAGAGAARMLVIASDAIPSDSAEIPTLERVALRGESVSSGMGSRKAPRPNPEPGRSAEPRPLLSAQGSTAAPRSAPRPRRR
jgi:transcriptional regulator with XRE-family HTH domain